MKMNLNIEILIFCKFGKLKLLKNVLSKWKRGYLILVDFNNFTLSYVVIIKIIRVNFQEIMNNIQLKDIAKIVSEGAYASQPAFNLKPENLRALISYIELMDPTLQALEHSKKLIKFYRFPIVIAFRFLYEKIEHLSEQKIQTLIESIKDIAAYVASALELSEIKIFDEVKFIFKWGKGKKKYKFSITQAEVQFAKFVYTLSIEKKSILDRLKITNNQDQAQELLAKLDDYDLKRCPTPFEQMLIEFIKESAVKQIQQFQGKQSEIIDSSQFPTLLKQTALKSELSAKLSKSQLQPQEKFRKVQQKKKEQDNKEKYRQEKQQSASFEAERQLPMCCRRYFVQHEVIEQPQNLRIQYKFYNFPFRNRPDEKPSKQEKIKRTLCGFLNSEGGIIFFGIKENSETKKRQADGYIMSQKKKIIFRDTIFQLLKSVEPSAQSLCTIKWVPIKNPNSGQFYHGRYIAKVIIEKGSKNQLYSYWHDKNQKFVFKTENQFLCITEAQKILKMFQDKLMYNERPVYKIHQEPCKEPLIGKPVYNDQSFEYEMEEKTEDYEPNQRQRQSNRPSAGKKRFREANGNEYLIFGLSTGQIKQSFSSDPSKLGSMTEIRPSIYLTVIQDRKWVKILQGNGVKIIPVYSRVRCSLEQKLIKDIVAEISQNQGMEIRGRQNGILSFNGTVQACQFWLRVKDLDQTALFTPDT